MLKQMQIQFIADKLADLEHPVIKAGDLDEPYASLYQEIEPLDDLELTGRVLWTTLNDMGLKDRDQKNQIIDQVLAALPERRHPFLSLHELADNLSPVDWLWPDWIPRGMLSLLGASPGAGKSLVALDLARRLIHTEAFPDETPTPTPGASVVYVDAEAVPQIQNERALAWKMNRREIYLMLPPEPYGMIDFGLEEHQDQLINMCHDIQPGLVVIDSLSSISTKGENNVEDVRKILGFLSAIAREFDVGLLLIHHLRKRSNVTPLMDLVTIDDFRGSSHIIAMARSVLALSIIQVDSTPDRNGPRRLEVIKTNLTRYPPALGLVFESAADDRAPTLRYTDPPQPHKKPDQADECEAWLVDLLQEADEPIKPKEVIELAKEEGFSRTVLYRARKKLKETVIDTASSNRSPDNRWTLAE